jgi:putative Mg2+ transporter-C (MgtC) family protein
MCGFLNWEIILQLVLAMVLGGLVGLEREFHKKEAGLRTFILVCLGATLFTVISLQFSASSLGKIGVEYDPTRIIGQIVLGIGFLCAGLIIFRGARVEGLTTAAALWITAAIGATIGVEFYFLAIFVTFLTVLILAGFRLIEEKLLKTKTPKDTHEI